MRLPSLEKYDPPTYQMERKNYAQHLCGPCALLLTPNFKESLMSNNRKEMVLPMEVPPLIHPDSRHKLLSNNIPHISLYGILHV